MNRTNRSVRGGSDGRTRNGQAGQGRVGDRRVADGLVRWTLNASAFARLAEGVLARLVVGGVLAAGVPALANPQGEQVVSGDVRFDRQPGLTNITASDGAIINYRSFDIARGDTVRFIQPSESARVLNRIAGEAPTRIDGSLLANGRVYLVNPAGVYFGRDSVVNVGALYAAAGNISDRDFQRRMDRFVGTGAVVNEGRIDANLVALVGQRVVNRGTINAPGGQVVLAAGRDILIGERGGHFFVRFENAITPVDGTGVDQSGTINAGGGGVVMAAGDLYGMAVYHQGVTRARNIRLSGGRGASAEGRSGVVSVSGTLDASGASNGERTGGDVRVLGHKVELRGATIDASGAAGGGTVLVGGNRMGRGPEANAAMLAVDAGTRVNADATERGDGGEVIFWSDRQTWFFGGASARGGVEGGSGGLIETSGKVGLVVSPADIDARARGAGNAGTWLIDPLNVTIDNPANQNGGFAGTNPETFTPTATGARVQANQIESRLNAGTSVVITTNAPGGEDGNITVDASINKNAGALTTLVLRAANNITVSNGQSITSSGGSAGLNLVLLAGDAAQTTLATSKSVLVQGNISLGAGTFFSSGNNFTLTAGDTITAAGVVLGPTTLSTAPFTGGTSIPLPGHTGAVAIDGTVSAGSGGVVSRGATFINTGAVTSTGPVDIGATTGVEVFNTIDAGASTVLLSATGAGGSVTLAASATGGGGVTLRGPTVTAQDDADFAASSATITADTFNLAALTGSGSLTIQPLTLSRGVLVGGGAVDPTRLSLTNSIIFQLAPQFASFTFGNAAGTGAVTVLPLTFPKTTTIRSGGAGGSITLGDSTDGVFAATGTALTFQAPTITLANNLGTRGQPVTFTGDVRLTRNVLIETNPAGFAAGANVGFGGGVATDGTPRTLDVRGGTGGVITFTGDVGSGAQRLGAVFLNGASVALSNVFTSGAQAYFVPVTLSGELDSLNSDITFGTGSSLTLSGTGLRRVNAGTATATLRNLAMGAADLDVVADDVRLIGAVTATGGAGANLRFFTATGSNGVTVGGGANPEDRYLTGAELALLSPNLGSVELTHAAGSGALSVDAAGATFPVAAVLTKAGSGTVNVNGGLFGTGAASLSLTGGTINLNANIGTEGDAVALNGNVVLGADVLVDTTQNAQSAGADVTVTGTLTRDGTARSFEARSGTGGTAEVQGDAGTAGARLNLFTLNGANVRVRSVRATGAQSYTGAARVNGTVDTVNSTVTFNNGLTLAGGSLIDSGTALTTLNGVAMSGFDLEVASDDVNLASGTLAGPGNLTLRTSTLARNVNLGGAGTAGTYDLTGAELGRLASSLTSITIGRVGGTGTLSVNAAGATFVAPTTLAMTEGAMSVDGALAGTGNGSLALLNSGSASTGITLNADVTTQGRAITFTGPVLLGTNVNVRSNQGGQSAGGAIAFNARTSGAAGGVNGVGAAGRTLTLNAGTGGLLTLNQAVGQSAPALGAITVEAAGGGVAINAPISAASLSITGGGAVNVAASSPITLATGAFALNTATSFTLGAGSNVSSVGASFTNAGVTILNSALNANAGALTVSGGTSFETSAASTLGATAITFTNPGAVVLRAANTTTSGAFQATGTGSLDLPSTGSVSSAAGVFINLPGAVTLAGNVTASGAGNGVDARSGAGLTASGALTGPAFINLHAGTDGTGNLVASGTLTSPDTTLRAGDGTGGAGVGATVTATGATILGAGGAGTSPATFTLRQDASISDGAIPGASQFGAGVSFVTLAYRSDDGSLTLADGTKVENAFLTLSSFGAAPNPTGVFLSGDIAPRSLTVQGPILLTADTILRALDGKITLGSVASANPGSPVALTLETNDEVVLNGGANSVGALSSLTVRPRNESATRPIRVGALTFDAGAMNFLSDSVNALANGIGQITFGRGVGSHDFTIGAADFKDNVLFLAPQPGGSFAVTGALRNVFDGGTITLRGLADGTPGDAAVLTSDIVTAGQAILIEDDVLLGAETIRLTTTGVGNVVPAGANITVTGTVNSQTSARNLELRAGTGGDVSVTQATGGVLALNTLSTLTVRNATFGAVTAAGVVQAEGDGSYGALTLGAGGLSLTGGGFTLSSVGTQTGGDVVVTNTGVLTINGPAWALGGSFTQGTGRTDLGTSIATTNAADADIAFNGLLRLTSDATLTSASGAITLAGVEGGFNFIAGAGAGSVLVNGVAPFGSTPLASATLSGGDFVQVGGTGVLLAAGPVTLQGGSVSNAGVIRTRGGVLNSTGGTFLNAGLIDTRLADGSGGGVVNINHAGDVEVGGVVEAGAGAFAAASDQSVLFRGTVTSGASVYARSARGGTGDIAFATGATLSAPAITFEASDGVGGVASARVLAASGAPSFRGAGGAGTSPAAFTLIQDAAVGAELPAQAQFGAGTADVDYTIESRDGTITLADGAAVAGSNLTLRASSAQATSALNLLGLRTSGALGTNAPITTRSSATRVNQGVVVGGAFSASDNALTIDSGDAGMSFAGSVTFAQDLSLIGDEVDFSGTITGAGARPGLSVRPFSPGRVVAVGGTTTEVGTLDLTSAELDQIDLPTISRLTVGDAGAGAVTGEVRTVGPQTFTGTGTDAFAVELLGRRVVLGGALTGTGTTSFLIDGALGVNLGADVTTAARPITVRGPVTLTGTPVTVRTASGGAGADVVFTGAIDADSDQSRDLTIDAGTGAGAGAVALQGDVGTVGAPRTLTVSGATIALPARVVAQAVDLTAPTITGTTTIITGSVALTTQTLNAANVTFNGPAVFRSSAAVNASGNAGGDPAFIVFNGALDAGADALTLALNTAGETRFAGDIGVTRGFGALTTDAPGTTAFDGSRALNATGGVFEFLDAVALRSDLTLNAATRAAFLGAVNSGAGLARSLTINSPLTLLTGVVGGQVGSSDGLQLGTLTTDAAGTTTIGRSLRADVIAINDGVTLTADTTLEGLTSLTLGAGAVSEENAARSLTVLSPNAVVRGNVGDDTTGRLGAFTTGSAGTLTIESSVFRAASATVSQLLNLGAGADVGVLGAAQFQRAVSSTGAATVSSNGATTFQDALTLGGALTVNAGGGARFSGVIASTAPDAGALIVNTPGGTEARFDASIGRDASGADLPRLSQFATAGDGTTIVAGNAVRAGIVSLGQNAVVGAGTIPADARVEVVADTASFNALNSSAADAGDLVLTVSGDAFLNGAVGGAARFRSLRTDTPGRTVVRANVSVAGIPGYDADQGRGIDFGDAVRIGNNATLDAGQGIFFARRTIDAESSAAPANLTIRTSRSRPSLGEAQSEAVDADIPVKFGGGIGGQDRLGVVSIETLSEITNRANIVFTNLWNEATGGITLPPGAGVNFTAAVNTRGFNMTRRARLLALGDLAISAGDAGSTAPVVISDISALGALSITQASSITILGRETNPSVSIGLFQVTEPSGVDYVSGRGTFFNVLPTQDNTGIVDALQARFADNLGSIDLGGQGGFDRVVFTDGVDLDLFSGGGNRRVPGGELAALDLSAEGAGTTQPPIAGLIPREQTVREPRQARPLDPETAAILREMGLFVRPDLTAEERVGALIGRAFYNDTSIWTEQGAGEGGRNPVFVPSTPNAGGRPYATAARVDLESLGLLVDAFSTYAYGAPGMAPSSPPAALASRAEAFGASWDAFAATLNGAEPQGDAFWAWLALRAGEASATDADRAAVEAIELLALVFSRLDETGLTARETGESKDKLTGDLANAVSERADAETVVSSQQVRAAVEAAVASGTFRARSLPARVEQPLGPAGTGTEPSGPVGAGGATTR